jgi:hypothetical protein
MAMVSCSSDYNYLASQMTFIYQRPRLDYSDLKPRYCNGVVRPPKEGEKFSR